MDSQLPIEYYCQFPSSSEEQLVRCCRCKEVKRSFDQLKSHIAWEHLNYTPYRCAHCFTVCRPTDFTLKIHIQESHPDQSQEPKMLYTPKDEQEKTLQSWISESYRPKFMENQLNAALAKASSSTSSQAPMESGGHLSPTPSLESGCSRTSESEGNALPSQEQHSSHSLDALPSTTTPPLLAGRPLGDVKVIVEPVKVSDHCCRLCSSEVSPQWLKAKKHDHVVKMHVRREDLNINRSDYGKVYRKCFPSPEKAKTENRRKYRGVKKLEVVLDRRETEQFPDFTRKINAFWSHLTSSVDGAALLTENRDAETPADVSMDPIDLVDDESIVDLTEEPDENVEVSAEFVENMTEKREVFAEFAQNLELEKSDISTEVVQNLDLEEKSEFSAEIAQNLEEKSEFSAEIAQNLEENPETTGEMPEKLEENHVIMNEMPENLEENREIMDGIAENVEEIREVSAESTQNLQQSLEISTEIIPTTPYVVLTESVSPPVLTENNEIWDEIPAEPLESQSDSEMTDNSMEISSDTLSLTENVPDLTRSVMRTRSKAVSFSKTLMPPISSTPEDFCLPPGFFGANPATKAEGPFPGIRSMRVCLTDGKFELGPNQVFCHLCRGTVPSSGVSKHVTEVHLETSSWTCKNCSFESSYSWNDVKRHLEEAHPNLSECMEDAHKSYREKAQDLLCQCFPADSSDVLTGISEIKAVSVTESTSSHENVSLETESDPKDNEDLKSGNLEKERRDMPILTENRESCSPELPFLTENVETENSSMPVLTEIKKKLPCSNDPTVEMKTKEVIPSGKGYWKKMKRLTPTVDEELAMNAICALTESSKLPEQVSVGGLTENSNLPEQGSDEPLTENTNPSDQVSLVPEVGAGSTDKPELTENGTGGLEETQSPAEKSKERKSSGECGLCHVWVASGSRSHHVRTVHFKKPLFRCAYCEYSKQRLRFLINHLNAEHKEKEPAVFSTAEYFRNRINELTIACFGLKPKTGKGLYFLQLSSNVKVTEVQGDEISGEKITEESLSVRKRPTKRKRESVNLLEDSSEIPAPSMKRKPSGSRPLSDGRKRRRESVNPVESSIEISAPSHEMEMKPSESRPPSDGRKRRRESVNRVERNPEISAPSDQVKMKPSESRSKPDGRKRRSETSKSERELSRIKEDLHSSQILKTRRRLRRRTSKPNYNLDQQTLSEENQDSSEDPSKKKSEEETGTSSQSDPAFEERMKKLEAMPREQARRLKDTCQICKKFTQSDRVRHIFVNHVKKPVGLCYYCGYTCTGDFSAMLVHLRRCHKNRPPKYRDERDKFQEELKHWMGRCFPYRYSQSGEGLGSTEATPGGGPAKQPAKKRRRIVKSEAMWVCRACDSGVMVEASRKTEHILVQHVKEDVFFCGFCDYKNKGSEDLCKQHIKESHPDKSPDDQSAMRNQTENLKMEIKCWERLCFGEEDGNQPRKRFETRESGVYCLLCKGPLCSGTDPNVHVLVTHLKKQVYFCQYCDYSNNGRESDCKSHIWKEHPGEKMEFRNELEQHRKELDEWKSQCFKPQEDGSKMNSQPPPPKKLCKPVFGKSKGFKPTGSKTSAPQRTCQLCGIVAGNGRGHVLAHHLKKPVFMCPYCDYGSICQATNVSRHIRRHHGENFAMSVVNKTGDFLDEIKKLMKRCFPKSSRTGTGQKRKNVLEGDKQENLQKNGLFNSLGLPSGSGSNGGKKIQVKMRTVCSWCPVPEKGVKAQRFDSQHLREQHVLLKHYRKKLYHCTLCAFKDYSLKYNVRRHITKFHPGQNVEIRDEKAEHQAAIDKMIADCFTSKRKRISTVALDKIKLFAKQIKESPEKKADTKFCNECKKEILAENVERHVYQVHLVEKCVRCPYCDFSVKYDPEQVETHIPVFHDGFDVHVDDRRGEIREKFDAKKKELFG